jgi:hypothetical protein
VLALGFEAARAAAALPGAEQSTPGTQPSLSKRASDTDAAVQKIQAEVNALERQVASAGPRARATLQARLAETRSELALAQARAQAFKALVDFRAQTGGSSGLLGQIEELERSVPEVRAEPAPHAAPAVPAAAATKPAAGVLGLFSELFSLARKRREIREVLAQTGAIRSQSDKLRAPLVAEVRATVQEGEQLTAAPDPTDPQLLAERKKRLDELTDHFKKASAVLNRG